MGWRLGIMAVLWTLWIWCSPAAAAIEQGCDSQDVIHIRSTGMGKKPEPLGTAQQEPPAAEEPTASMSPPPPAPPRESVINGPASTARAKPEAIAAPTACRAAVEGPPPPAANQSTAEVCPPGNVRGEVETSSPPVSCAVPGPAPEPPSKIVSAAIAATPAKGTVARFQDHKGVMHITNVGSGVGNGEASPLLAANGERKEMVAAASPTEPPAMTESGRPPTFKPVSYLAGDSGALTSSRAPLPNRPLAANQGDIRHYRDAQGVWHITNVPAEDPLIRGTPLLAVRGGLRGGHDPPGNLTDMTSPGVKQPTGQNAIKQVSWINGDIGPPMAPKITASKESQMLASGTIKRYRDAKAVLHIESVEPQEPLPLPGPALWTAPDHYGIVNPTLAGVAPPGVVATRTALHPDSSPPLLTRIVATRNRQGILSISNPEAEASINRAPPPAVVSAALEYVIQEASQRYCLPVTLIQALIKAESNFVPWAVSPKGAMGLMQLMPGTAASLGVRDAFEPWENIQGGCRYLRLMLDYFHGSLPLALAAYNAGFQRVVACGYQVPPIKETQEFVTQVLGRFYISENQRPPWT